ncbi:hypothetical protein EV368DRAFT_61678 [Lentinula lateritia]|nr:hypothetical protein EV368DRAFT_61678 [Lentinula lateritia]
MSSYLQAPNRAVYILSFKISYKQAVQITIPADMEIIILYVRQSAFVSVDCGIKLLETAPALNNISEMFVHNSSLGYPEIGVLLSGVLFGILTMQVYIYHNNFPNDPGWIKFGLVDGMWLFELAHTICEFYGLYYVTVLHYGDPTVFLAFSHELAAIPFCDGLIATIMQGFFAHRIAKFAGPPYTVPIVCCILMVGQMVASIGLSAAVLAERSTHQFLDQWTWLIITAETVVVTSSISIIVMICFLINPTNFLWIAFYAMLPKFFSNAMLANLNSRMKLRDMQVTTVTELVTIPSLEVQTSLPETPHVPMQ